VVNLNRFAWSVCSGLPGQFQPDFTITCLTYNFDYIDKELREFFKYLKSENSELVRYALYCLLIKHSNDQQLKSTLRVQLSKETSTYLKLITLDYWKKDTNRVNTMDELVKQMGL
jgi:hypothetical protein